MPVRIILFCLFIGCIASCTNTRIKEKTEWAQYFESNGLAKANSCFEMRDNNHEAIYYYNLDRCSRRFTPASTFKIFNSLTAFETAVASDDQLVIRWDSVQRRPEWDKDMTMHEAFRVSCVPYYQEIAGRIGPGRMQHYLDTIKYGNMNMGGSIDKFWLNDSLKISPDEQTGFLKKLYFVELPVSERSQRITKTLMLQEQTPDYNLYYKMGTAIRVGDTNVYWIVGIAERIEHVKEHKESMNKSDFRYYPYFFAENFAVPKSDTTKNWNKVRMDIMHNILKAEGIITN